MAKLTREQHLRYLELMDIAENGEYMSALEFDELTKLLRMRDYQQEIGYPDTPDSVGGTKISDLCQVQHAYEL